MPNAALAGSESTLAMTLAATVTLMPALPHRVLVVLGYDDVYAAADAVPDVMASRPVALEGLDRGLADDLRRAGLDATNLDLLPAGVAARNPSDLASAMEKLGAMDICERDAMGREGRALVEREYSQEAVIQAYLEALAQLCPPRGS